MPSCPPALRDPRRPLHSKDLIHPGSAPGRGLTRGCNLAALPPPWRSCFLAEPWGRGFGFSTRLRPKGRRWTRALRPSGPSVLGRSPTAPGSSFFWARRGSPGAISPHLDASRARLAMNYRIDQLRYQGDRGTSYRPHHAKPWSPSSTTATTAKRGGGLGCRDGECDAGSIGRPRAPDPQGESLR